MSLTSNVSKHNFRAFLWHAVFLAFAQNFMDVDTVVPAMVAEAGGQPIHIGIISAIMMGGSSFTQLFFAPMISHHPFKKKFLLAGINFRIASLFALALILYVLSASLMSHLLWYIFLFISIFSFSGAFTNISFVDILGKSIISQNRKAFFSARQIVGGIVVLVTAFAAKNILSAYTYPANYALMFLVGGSALLIASLGFWNIKETEASGSKISGIRNFLETLSSEWKNNPKLKYYLGFINTQGIAMSVLPFVILYSKETFHTGSAQTGLYLLFKVIGVVSVSMLVLMNNKKIRFNMLLYSNVLLSILFSFAVVLIDRSSFLPYIFLLGGVIVSLYVMTMNGVLLEISGNENRALYTGFAGAGNLLPMLFPLVAGGIIERWGYTSFFAVFAIVVSLSAFFIYKIKCKK